MSLNELHALMMRAVAREIMDKMSPDLRYPGARERAEFAETALEFLAAHLDILPGIAEEGIALLRGALDAAFAAAPDSEVFAAVGALRRRYAGIEPRGRGGADQEISELRALAADAIRALSDLPAAGLNPLQRDLVARCISAVGDADSRWVSLFSTARAARKAKTATGITSDRPATPSAEQVTADGMTSYLRRHFPNAPMLRVTGISLISGGRSKRTMRIALENAPGLPAIVVMRQDVALKHVGSRIRDEVEPLVRLHARGLPVPNVLHYEPAQTELGQPFLLVPFLNGAPPGDYFGLRKKCSGAYRDLAKALALLHTTPPDEVGLAAPDGAADPLRAHIEAQWSIWRKSLRPSPTIDLAFSIASRACRETKGAWSVVHGDCGPHNLLVEDDRLVTLLDWEFAHAGDPAEDLGITRIYAEETMDWADFMAVYRAAGGPDIPERRVRAGMLSHYLKGAALSAMSTRNFFEGGTTDYVKGMISFTGLPQIEMKLVALMARLD